MAQRHRRGVSRFRAMFPLSTMGLGRQGAVFSPPPGTCLALPAECGPEQQAVVDSRPERGLSPAARNVKPRHPEPRRRVMAQRHRHPTACHRPLTACGGTQVSAEAGEAPG